MGASFAAAVADRYDLVRPIGRGGYGVVYEAWDKQRNARVALKKLNHLTPAAAHRLKREFRALSGVAHKNLVRLFELEESDGEPFLTMELVDGVDVLSWIWRLGRGAFGPGGSAASAPDSEDDSEHKSAKSVRVLPVGEPRPYIDEERLRDAMAQLCDGLVALHAAGLLHRDVKPSNVLVTREGRVVVLDFGIVLELHVEPLRLTDADVVVGTPEYMAPEQGSQQELGPPADFYALGVMMFEALAGSMPFPTTGAQVLVDKLRDPAPSVRSIAPDAPADLASLVDDLLEIEPSRRPDAEQIRARLGAAPASEQAPTSRAGRDAQTSFVGRSEALHQLSDAFARARRGRAQLVRVQGVSGMGKTSLLRHFFESIADRDDVVVLSGRCYENESVPYKGFDGVIDSLVALLQRVGDPLASAVVPRDAAMLARVFPLLERVPQIAAAPRRSLHIPDPRQLRMRAFASLRELLARLADRRGLVLAIDDVQWGDADSAALVAELTAPPDPPAMLMILASRSERLRSSSQIRALLDPDRAIAPDNHLVLVDALSHEEAKQLARTLLTSRPDAIIEDALVEKIARESAGSPFFIGELAQDVSSSSGRVDLDEVRLDRVLSRRVNELPPFERRLLEIVSLADRPVRQGAAFSAAKLGHAEGRGALGALRAAHLLRTAGVRSDQIEPYHDRVRETVVAAIDESRIKELHQALLSACADSKDPELLFTHSRGAGLAQEAIKWAEAAAEKASAALAFDRAAFYYGQARSLVVGARQRIELGRKLADALASAGRGVAAADAYLEAASGATFAEGIEWRSRAGELLMLAGRVERGREITRDVANDVGLWVPDHRVTAIIALLWLRLRLYLRGDSFRERAGRDVQPALLRRLEVNRSIASGLAVVDNLVCMVLVARYYLTALRAGEPERVARGMVAWAGFIGRQGGRSALVGQELIARAEPLVHRAGTPNLRAHLAWARAWIAYFTGHFAAARAHFGESLLIFRDECAKQSWEVATTEHFELLCLLYTGELEEFGKLHPRYMREADERGDQYLAASLRSSFNISAWLMTDDPSAARAAIAAGIAAWPRVGFQTQHWWELEASVWTDLYDDQPERALSRIDDRWPLLSRSLMLHMQLIRIEAAWLRGTAAVASARAAASAGKLARALDDAAAIEREGMPWGQALAALLRGAISMRRDQPDVASVALAEAAQQLERAGLMLHAAFAKRRAAILRGESGATDLQEAEAWMRQRNIIDTERFGRVFGV